MSYSAGILPVIRGILPARCVPLGIILNQLYIETLSKQKAINIRHKTVKLKNYIKFGGIRVISVISYQFAAARGFKFEILSFFITFYCSAFYLIRPQSRDVAYNVPTDL